MGVNDAVSRPCLHGIFALFSLIWLLMIANINLVLVILDNPHFLLNGGMSDEWQNILLVLMICQKETEVLRNHFVVNIHMYSVLFLP